MRKSLVYRGVVISLVAVAIVVVMLIVFRKPEPRIEDILAVYRDEVEYSDLTIQYPLNETLFPPEIVPPTFRWKDGKSGADRWLITIKFQDDVPLRNADCGVRSAESEIRNRIGRGTFRQDNRIYKMVRTGFAESRPSCNPVKKTRREKSLNPKSVRDHRWNDLTEVLSLLDGRHAVSFDLTRFHGLTKTHTLLMDFGDISAMKKPVLVLTGWIEWIDGDTLYSLGQGAGPWPLGPVLEMQKADGGWEKVSENIGVPAGIGKNVVVELPPRLCGESARLRIITNQEIYWDRAAVGDAGASPPVRKHAFKLIGANLHFRGFSRVVRAKSGKPPWYDYADVTAEAPYLPQQGLVTRYGDVLPLLTARDARLVVFGPGDELTLTFSIPPKLSSEQNRDYLLRFDGWIKDANPSTFAGDRVEPLPYRAMSGYPFGAEEGMPDDPSYAEYLSRYNTRVLRRDAMTLRWSGLSRP